MPTKNELRREAEAAREQHRDWKRREFAKALLERGYSMTCTTEHLGLMVGPNIADCPAGWVFVPQEMATEDLIVLALEHLDKGRTKWPKKPTQGKKSADQLLDEVFDSQDYIGT